MTYASSISRAPHPVGLRNVFHIPTAVDGARPGSAEAFSRSRQVGVEHAIRSASPATLLSSMKNAAIPEHLTPGQQEAIANLLDKYHPRTLADSPLIDARGKPIPLHLAATPLTDPVTGEAVPVRSSSERGLVRMFTNYRQHLNWEHRNLSIRKIEPGGAEPELTGQDGVFANKDIPRGTPVTMFGGMHLTDPEDIALDDRIRNMAGIGVGKYRVRQEGGTIQGMGASMKLNAGDAETSNVFPLHLNALGAHGEKMKIMAFFASRPIKAGEELRFNYKVEK